jgi:hypothetical protein
MTTFNNIPEGEHYAIIEEETIHIPGDERSRTHPGHGYPAENRQVMTYHAYALDKRDEWVKEIERRKNQPFSKNFKALHVRPAMVTTKTFVFSVEVE